MSFHELCRKQGQNENLILVGNFWKNFRKKFKRNSIIDRNLFNRELLNNEDRKLEDCRGIFATDLLLYRGCLQRTSLLGTGVMATKWSLKCRKLLESTKKFGRKFIIVEIFSRQCTEKTSTKFFFSCQ
jgi:hypothetical protein